MATEEQLKELEEELQQLGIDHQEEIAEKYGSPDPEKKESMFKFFREMLNFVDTWKVANLKDAEIGQSTLSVRSYLELGLYAGAEKMDIVSEYFESKARILAATSMGRDGFFPQIVVTNIKKNQTVKEKPKSSGGLFGGKKDES